MLKRLLAPILALAAITASASTTHVLQGQTYTVDTLQHYKSGPGVTFTRLHYSGPANMDVCVITMENNPIHRSGLQVVLGNDSCRNAETISSMARRHTTADRQIIGGTNGDFFITSSFAATLPWGNNVLGFPNMSCVTEGKLAAPDVIDKVSRENAFITDNEGGMWIDATDMTYKLLNNDGSVNISMAPSNFPRGDADIVFYNSNYGRYTKTSAGGREIAVKLADGANWRMNKSIKFTVVGDWSTAGNMAIPADGGVLSLGSAYSHEWVNNLKEGDIIKIKYNLKLPAFDNLAPDIKSVIGGDVRILNSGITTMEANRWINARDARNPRTMIGYSEDRSKVVLCTVDGRGVSVGCTYPEGADIMRNLGCYDALDFDGGGSTAMYLSHCGIANKISDSSERAVGNGIFVYIDAPADNEIAEIRFADWAKTLPAYGIYYPVIYGYNRYGQLVNTAVPDYTLSCLEGLGEIVKDGKALFAKGSGCHALTATYNGLSATIAVDVNTDNEAQPLYPSILIDNHRVYTAQMQALVGSQYMSVDPIAFDWSSSNEQCVTVDNGVIRGLNDGSAVVTATVGSHTATINVTVETPPADVVPIDQDPNHADWKITKTSVASASIGSISQEFSNIGRGMGLGVDFSTGTSVRGSKISLAKDIRLSSLPDMIHISMAPGDLTVNNIILTLLANNQTRSVSVTKPFVSEPNIADNTALTHLYFNIDQFFDTDDIGIYPIHFVSCAFDMSPATKSSYHIDIPHLDVIYKHYTGGVNDVIADRDTSPSFSPIVDGQTVVLPRFADAVEVFNINGARVCRGISTDRLTLPSAKGVYIVRARFDGICKSAKIVVR